MRGGSGPTGAADLASHISVPVDMAEETDAYTFTADLPGVARADTKVCLLCVMTQLRLSEFPETAQHMSRCPQSMHGCPLLHMRWSSPAPRTCCMSPAMQPQLSSCCAGRTL